VLASASKCIVKGYRCGGIMLWISFFDSHKKPPFMIFGLAAEKKKNDLARIASKIHIG
jgi:hypothetical protein